MSAYPRPRSLLDVEGRVRRVHEIQLAVRVRAVEVTIPAVCSRSVGADFDNRDAIEHPSSAHGVRLECLDHKPLLRVRAAYVLPSHGFDEVINAMRAAATSPSGEALPLAVRRLP